MARGVNKVILIGHLGKDPELRYTPSGTAICSFSLATTTSRKKADGEWEEITDWHRVKTFGKTAENAGQYLSKGKQVYIEGRISYGSYDDKDGVKRYTTDILVNEMQFLGGRGESSGRDDGDDSHSSRPPQQRTGGSNYEPPPPEEDEEDLPF